jgi:phage major head subunit gpT-like protein
MLKGYDESQETFQEWTNEISLSDFKAQKLVDIGTFANLTIVREGGEYTYGTTDDRGETIQLATYGKMFSITRQSIINDDLNAFTRVPRAMGRAAIRTVGDMVYAILTANTQVMSDGEVLFSASHSPTNIGTAGGITTTSVAEMQKLMALQKDSNVTSFGIRLDRLVVPVALEGSARVVATSQFQVDGTNVDPTLPNQVQGTFAITSDARLDADSAVKWYGVGNQGIYDTVSVAYLDGQRTPYMEQQNGWSVDGVEYKVRIDAAAKALDWRAMAYNAGA